MSRIINHTMYAFSINISANHSFFCVFAILPSSNWLLKGFVLCVLVSGFRQDLKKEAGLLINQAVGNRIITMHVFSHSMFKGVAKSRSRSTS